MYPVSVDQNKDSSPGRLLGKADLSSKQKLVTRPTRLKEMAVPSWADLQSELNITDQ